MRIGAMIALLAVSLSLWSCGIQQQVTPEPTSAPTTEPTTEPTTQPTTVPTTEPTTEPTTVPTTVPTTEPATAPVEAEKENIQQVKAVGAYIFREPSYDGDVVQPMPRGTYTIVREKMDEEGNLWGELKSGLGWICLTDIRNFDQPVAIGELDPELKKKGDYQEIAIYDGTYAIPVAIQACEKLTDVFLYSCELRDGEMAPAERLTGMDTLAKGKVLVLWLEFPGDSTTFQLEVVDSRGNPCSYQIATSGRNATLSVWPVA